MLTLGLSGHFSNEDTELAPDLGGGFFHDAAACLIRDGELLVAVEEERLNRIKQTTKFPINAIRACLAESGVSPREISAVGHYFARDAVDLTLTDMCLRNNLPLCSSSELILDNLNNRLSFELKDDQLFYIAHHVSHAMSCFIRSGMKEALVAVMDARGESQSTTIFHGSDGQLREIASYGVDKSLGNFYKKSIGLLGYGLGDEYKVMGLAPYGNPDAYGDLFDAMYSLKEQGDFDVSLRYESFFAGGFVPRAKGNKFSQQHIDFAAGLQQALEKIAMHVLDYWARQTGLVNLCFVGGVAHNSSLNGLILRSKAFKEVFIHPASHDAGAAEGAALATVQRLGGPSFRQLRLRSASVGPGLGSDAEIAKELESWTGLIGYEKPSDIVEATARLLAEGSVVGWAQGRSEFGPRALGNRSILADPRPSENKERINSMVKKREGYRPFAPVVIAEAAEAYFHLPAATKANYDFMSFVVKVREDRKSELGAVTHIDGSARVQVIDPASDKRFYDLVRRFGEITKTPVLLNTSFNNNAEPIVQSVHDAVTCFLTTDLNFLVIENFLIRRKPDSMEAMNELILRFRPTTRLAKRIRITLSGAREVIHEIFLDYPNGPRAEVSPAMFALLAAADGSGTLESIAEEIGGLSTETAREVYNLWQGRYFVLYPPGGSGA
jgi:predicted NodU family carbamoyl transferase